MIGTVLRRPFRAPAFALVVAVLVASVVAVNATAFGAIHALRWKALPYADAGQLVELRADLTGFGFKLGLTERLREAVAADREYFAGALGFSGQSQPRRDSAGLDWRISRVGGEFGSLLGTRAEQGRLFADDDLRDGADAVLVLSDRAWHSHFGADPAVIGRSVRLPDRSYTVIGVTPPGFAFPDASVDAWRPYVMTADERQQSEGGNVGDLDVVARLAPGVGIAQAQQRLQAIFVNDGSVAGLLDNAGLRADVRSWRDRYAATHWQALSLLQLAALILLAVVAANLVNLNLDRLLGRAHEFAVRRALGASERAIARGVVADLAPPVGVGLLVGLLLTPLGLHLAASRGLLPTNLPQGNGIGPAAVLAGGLVALLALATGLVAVLVSRRPPALGRRAGIGGLGTVRPAMLVGQVMLTTALLGATGLLLRSAINLIHSERGFDDRGVLLTLVDPPGVSLSGRSYDPATDSARYLAVAEALRSDIAALPGVQHVATASAAPFTGWERVSNVRQPGIGESQARLREVGPGYFAALGIGLGAGREFEPADPPDQNLVVVDELYRQRFLRDVDPLQSSVELPADDKGNFKSARIVGVAATVKHEKLDEAANLPTVYALGRPRLPVYWMITRTRGDPATLAMTVRQRIQAIAPGTDIGVNQPLSELVGQTLSARRALLEAIAGFTAATLLLAGIGLAAVLSFAIRRRTSELGVRLAIGATPARVRNLVLRQGGLLIGIGAALGLLVGLPLARLLGDRLYGVSAGDVPSWTAATLAVCLVALFACWLPARRAARTDPLVALRSE